jgi:predicted DNA-binding transcriptional regulator AlpA
MENKRIRIAECIIRLGVGRTTFYRRIEQGVYPGVQKDGRMGYWLLSVLEEVISGKYNQPTLASSPAAAADSALDYTPPHMPHAGHGQAAAL